MMNYTARRYLGSVFIVSAFLFISHKASSAAWTLPEQAQQAIHSVHSYFMHHYFDSESERKDRDLFYKLEYSVLYEKGYNPQTTIGIKHYLQYIHDKSPSLSPQLLMASSADIFLRRRLYQNKSHAVSFQPLITLPALYSHTHYAIDRSYMAVEARMLHVYSFQLNSYDSYINTELAYRYHPYTSLGSMQLDMTLGIHLSSRHMLLAQSFSSFDTQPEHFIVSLSDSDAPTDYDLHKLQLSYVFPITSSSRAQLGGFVHAYGRNTGGGGGLVFSLWKPF